MLHRYSHLREKLLRTTYNALGFKLTGTLKFCDGCARSKAKSRAVRNKTYTRASQPGESIVVDTTDPFPDSLIGNRYCIDIVDNYSRYSWSFFMKTKSQLPNKMDEIFENMMPDGTLIKHLRYDNTKEKQSKLQRACEKVNMTLEYTTPHMPHMNGVIKRRFAVIKEGALAMLINAKLNETAQKML